jgi:hypothetical protein
MITGTSLAPKGKLRGTTGSRFASGRTARRGRVAKP